MRGSVTATASPSEGPSPPFLLRPALLVWALFAAVAALTQLALVVAFASAPSAAWMALFPLLALLDNAFHAFAAARYLLRKPGAPRLLRASAVVNMLKGALAPLALLVSLLITGPAAPPELTILLILAVLCVAWVLFWLWVHRAAR